MQIQGDIPTYFNFEVLKILDILKLNSVQVFVNDENCSCWDFLISFILFQSAISYEF